MKFLIHSENCFCFQSALVSWFLSVLMAFSASQFQFLFWGNFALPVAEDINGLYVLQNIIQFNHFILVLCSDNKSEFSSLFQVVTSKTIHQRFLTYNFQIFGLLSLTKCPELCTVIQVRSQKFCVYSAIV